MSDFQVGDRVSVEGVVVDPYSGHLTCIQFDYGDEVDVPTAYVTLVELPKRKLRVGSVWERPCTDNDTCRCGKVDRYVWIGHAFVSPSGDEYPRESRDFDENPDRWREVPVAELEREAK